MESQLSISTVKQADPTPQEAKVRVLKFVRKFAGVERRAGNYAGAAALDAISRAVESVPVDSYAEKAG